MSNESEHEFSPGDYQESRERSLEGQIALVTNVYRDSGAEIAIALAQEGVRIKGIVGNSQREREEAKKVAMHIEYNITPLFGGDIDIIYADVIIPKELERLQKAAVGRQGLDILIVHGLYLLDELSPCVNRGGKIVLVQDASLEEQLVRERNTEFQEKGVSFAVVRISEEVTADQVGKRVLEITRQKDLPQGHVEHLTRHHDRG